MRKAGGGGEAHTPGREFRGSPPALERRLGTNQKKNMAEQLSSVRPEHKFDEGALQDYLVRNLPGFPRNHGEWTVLQYRFVLFHVTGASVLNV